MKERLVLIDGNAILHRAYHALPPLTNRSGELVNAVYGFSSMLLKILAELKPKYIAVSFDTAGVSFRNTDFIGYKANRPKMDEELVGQIEKVHQVVKAFNIPIFTADGYEADDVIGSLAKQATGEILSEEDTKILSGKKKKQAPNILISQYPNIEVLIVTGDKDLMQLVNEKTKLFMPTKGLSEGQIVGVEEVKEKMGIPPEKIADYKGLVGDPSDNYPGVPGIGPKTAVRLIEKFGSVEGLYRKIAEGKEGLGEQEGQGRILTGTTVKKLKEGAESAVLSKKLATVITDVPVKLNLEACVARDFDKEKVVGIFRQLGFRSLIGRVMGESGKDPTSSRHLSGLRGASKEDERQQSLF